MRTLFRLTLCSLTLVLLSSAANASVLTWYLNGVKFDDGGTASGSFNFDPDGGTPCSTGATPCGRFSNVSITTTSGSTRTGATYTFVCGQDVPTCTGVSPDSTAVLNLTSSAANQTGLPAFALFFTGVGGTPPQGLTDFGGTIDVSNSSASVGAGLEASCADAACSAPAPPTRITVAGVVASSETLEQYFFFGG
jgi:hypothetical protein